MSEDSEHWSLNVEALELWGSGQLDQARRKYEAAIALCPPTHWALWNYRGAYAGVLAALGLMDEAGIQLELVLELALADADGEDTAGVGIARYFLGFHCVQVKDFERALDVIAHSLSVAGNSEALLRSVQARALAGLGRHAEAQAAATTAIATARSDKQRDKLSDELADLLQPGT